MEKIKSQLEEIRRSNLPFNDACQKVIQVLRGIPNYDWIGIYMVEGDELVLGEWDGPKATDHKRIKIGQGICSLAVKEDRTVIVDDVNADSRYLACFPETKSEIVIPIRVNNEVVGEIDIDSDQKAKFSEPDRRICEFAAETLSLALRK